jgi:hypothetical protein
MKVRFILLILFITSLAGAGSFFSLLWYFDPYSSMKLSLLLLATSFTLMLLGILTLIIYFCKKIYYRWWVGMYHMYASLRQSVFFVFFILWVIVFVSYNIPIVLPVLLLLGILIFFELFVQSFC